MVDELADVAGIVGQLVDDRRHPEHDAEHRRRGDQAPLPPITASPPGHVTERGEHKYPGRHEVGHVGLRAQRPGHDGGHEHQRSPQSTAQTASRTTIHDSSGRYGFDGWVGTSCP